jgi:hypothetical protein
MEEYQEALLPGLVIRSPSGNYSVTFLQILKSAKLARIMHYEL